MYVVTEVIVVAVDGKLMAVTKRWQIPRGLSGDALGGISVRAWRLRCGGGSGDLGSATSAGHYQGQAVLQGGSCSQVMQY